ncbi:hypothetical protein [Pseudomonas nitroreducens]|uniref:hypothetical protein n=1 Tax=Pseudomonas nitroreducens TaxID=46680 RepID=UPI00351CD6CA
MLLKFDRKFKNSEAWKKGINTIGDISEGRIKLLPGLETINAYFSGKPAGGAFLRNQMGFPLDTAAPGASPAALLSSLIHGSGSASGDRCASGSWKNSKTKLPPEFE